MLRTNIATESAVDEVLTQSFPASDPPSWNQGMARLGPGTRPSPREGFSNQSDRSSEPSGEDATAQSSADMMRS